MFKRTATGSPIVTLFIWQLIALLTSSTARACCEEAEAALSGPNVAEVCSTGHSFSASGTPDGGWFEWHASAGTLHVDGSSATWDAPQEPPHPGSVSISVTYKYICYEDPNNPVEKSDTAGISVTLTPKPAGACAGDGATGQNIIVRVAPPPCHIDDMTDEETLTAEGTDPDDTDCGCEQCSSDGMNLGATQWTCDSGHLAFAPTTGASTVIYSVDSAVGSFSVKATFHDYSAPAQCNDAEGTSWTATTNVQTFRVGVRLGVDGGGAPKEVYENEGEVPAPVTKQLQAHMSHETPLEDIIGSGVVEPLGASALATFTLASDPDGLVSMKGTVGASIAGTHPSASIIMWGYDTDWDVSSGGIGTIRVGINLGIVSIAWAPPPWSLSDDCVAVVAGGYGAGLEGTAPDVEVAGTYATEYDQGTAEHTVLPIPAFSRNSTFAGKPGEQRRGEVELGSRIEWKDGDPSNYCYIEITNPAQGPTILTVTWSLPERPSYVR